MDFEAVRRLFHAFTEEMGPAARMVFEDEVRAIAPSPSKVPRAQWGQLVGALCQRLGTPRAQQAFMDAARTLTAELESQGD